MNIVRLNTALWNNLTWAINQRQLHESYADTLIMCVVRVSLHAAVVHLMQ